MSHGKNNRSLEGYDNNSSFHCHDFYETLRLENEILKKEVYVKDGQIQELEKLIFRLKDREAGRFEQSEEALDELMEKLTKKVGQGLR